MNFQLTLVEETCNQFWTMEVFILEAREIPQVLKNMFCSFVYTYRYTHEI